METLATKWVFFSWPLGQFQGKEVRRYHTLFEKYNITNWGNTLFVVTEINKANYRGGPDTGTNFNTLKEALDYIHDLVH